MEATWTPNEDSEAPLPLSQNQRQQLLQLEQAIVTSPDPQGTLMQVAQQNNMDPNELVDLLERNHQAMVESGDIPAGGGGGGQPPRRRNVWKAMTSLGVVLSQSAKSNPRAFSLAVTTLLLTSYMGIMAPRTGLVISSNRRGMMISKGPTTMFTPPNAYLYKVLDSQKIIQKDPTYAQAYPVQSLLNPFPEGDDGVVWQKLSKPAKKLLKQVASAQVTLDVDDDGGDEEDDGVLDVYFTNAQRVLEEGQFTEWVEPKDSIKMVVHDNNDNAVLVVKGMGDYGRYGLLFLRPVDSASSSSSTNKASVVYSTLRGSHFDGQFYIEAIRKRGVGVTLQVHLLIPKKGRTISKGQALKLVEAMSESIAQSIKNRSQQALARRSQSARFQGNAKTRASERRQTRHRLEKEIEEMSEDRRRRWQRQNPNSGSYRPSNRRQQSPNNC